MKKRSMPLSTLLDNAVADNNPSPNYKLYRKISHVAKKNEQVCLVLRLQLLNKLRSHPFRFIPSLEVYYCVCLMEYLIIKMKSFLCYITDEEFVKALDKMAQFNKLVGLFKSKPTLTQLKVMNFIQLVIEYEDTELYKELFEQYKAKGVQFPPLVEPEYEDDSTKTSLCQTPSVQIDEDDMKNMSNFVVPKFELKERQHTFRSELPKPPVIAQTDHELFSPLPEDFRKLLQKMAEFHELCKEPLKKSNLLRNGSLQIRHQLQCDESFFQKALDIQKEFKRQFNEYSNLEDCDDEIVAALTEEGRKIGHIVRVFKNEISRVKKLETKIESGVGEVVLAEVPSYDVDAMMTATVTYPKTHGDAVKIMDMMSHTKGNTLSRDDSVTESATESTSNSATPSGIKHNGTKKYIPPLAQSFNGPQARPMMFKSFKGLPKNTQSVDTSRLYTGYL
ncbi:hypothetical protein EIN_253390 [Entamoeba invadens IP1]|uniref:Uncharacterized protein n=2 Tax=Entamoeba invadens TaxID=33085 RepID=A0A0A1UET3_ENTIV|nr:hypothetical protein EIN_253390 [Entamoeba invadens IP1]ELP95075.1 hypothetical protein EIN_253390 [Entamoeba invadens IP1]BAN40921.1 hypothetical protein [Entamoeba invadens]|eukprot:XP_004261846.1 hypothetical protein EIN_253390 [Entamoeba invadens IP1]